MTDFLFPDVGEGINEGKLIAWKIKEGDTVKQDQIICEVETDKAVVEIPAPQAGVVSKLHHATGAVLKVGEPLVTFGGSSTQTPVTTSAPAYTPTLSTTTTEFKRPIESGTNKVESNFVPTLPATLEHAPSNTTVVAAVNAPVAQRIIAAPSTRRLARERSISIENIKGTGSGGRVMDSDVLAASGAPVAHKPPQTTTQTTAFTPTPVTAPVTLAPTTQTPAPLLGGTSVPYSGRRKAIGDHMMLGHAIPTVTMFARADITRLMETREHLKAHAEKLNVKLTPLAFFVKGVCATLKTYPIFNSTLSGDTITLIPNENIGIAVDTPKGLVVPVVKNADTLSILEIAKQMQLVADAARANTLKVEQVRGSTFTVSSVGAGRVEGFTQILNTPEEAILGIGGILDEVRAVNGAPTVRKVVTLSLTFDHRVADGADGAKFLTTLVTMLEDPELLLLGGA